MTYHGADERLLLRPGELCAVGSQLLLRLRHEPLDDYLDLVRQREYLGLFGKGECNVYFDAS